MGEQNKIDLILNTILDGFYIVDKDGNFVDTNDQYCKMIGYSKNELLKMGVKDVEAIDSQDVIKNRIKTILEKGCQRFESKHKRKDGIIIDIEASVTALKDGSGYLYCFMRDITERKKLEESQKEVLRQTLELNHFMMDRELKMAELKKENEELRAKLASK